MGKLTFKHALTPEGIVADRVIEFDEAGVITAIGEGGAPYDGDLALPALANAHSHAFQRALCGRGEARAGADSFWSWREAMYALAARIDPDMMYAVARLAYAEMVAAGFTAVGEFHYLHHLPDGGKGTAMADAVIAAARDTGIRLRMLPVYYHRGGFGEPATARQSRFTHASVDDFLAYVDTIDHPYKGVAPHSLRAVPVAHLEALAAAEKGPLHIHISEQIREVEECVAAHRRRPVELLADTVTLDRGWTLVHATHADENELAMIRSAGACVALCPLTEAYLGDGVFPATTHIGRGGMFAVGSDSNVRIDAIEELRWLEYGQRLVERKRARLADADGIGIPLWRGAAAGGAQATGFPVGTLAPGSFADIVVLPEAGAPWAGLPAERWLDSWLTGGGRADIGAIFIGGMRVAEHGEVADADGIRAAFAAVQRALG